MDGDGSCLGKEKQGGSDDVTGGVGWRLVTQKENHSGHLEGVKG